MPALPLASAATEMPRAAAARPVAAPARTSARPATAPTRTDAARDTFAARLDDAAPAREPARPARPAAPAQRREAPARQDPAPARPQEARSRPAQAPAEAPRAPGEGEAAPAADAARPAGVPSPGATEAASAAAAALQAEAAGDAESDADDDAAGEAGSGQPAGEDAEGDVAAQAAAAAAALPAVPLLDPASVPAARRQGTGEAHAAALSGIGARSGGAAGAPGQPGAAATLPGGPQEAADGPGPGGRARLQADRLAAAMGETAVAGTTEGLARALAPGAQDAAEAASQPSSPAAPQPAVADLLTLPGLQADPARDGRDAGALAAAGDRRGVAAQAAVPVAALPLEIGLRALEGGQRFEIRLHPEDLGRVDVRLDLAEDGTVKAQLTVDRVETLALLQRDARTLERAFEQAGLRTGADTLSFSLGQSGAEADRRQTGREADPDTVQGTPRSEADTARAAAGVAAALRALGVPGGGLDIRI